jgi:cytoskeletal protein CcmA (bactofilin family)
MQHAAHIGPTVLIKGEISARENISVSGRVEGTIDVAGHNVTIEAGAHVEADVTADGVVVAGTIHGSLVAEHRIELRGSAVVEGDLTAPRVSVEDGAVVRGKVDIAGTRAADLARAS